MKGTPKDNAPGLAMTEGANKNTEADSSWRGLNGPMLCAVLFLLCVKWPAGLFA